MSAYVHSALRYSLPVPAWLLAVALATAIAIGVAALVDGSDRPPAAPASAQPAGATLPQQDTVCLNSRDVGHC
jgi:hypothetical protein